MKWLEMGYIIPILKKLYPIFRDQSCCLPPFFVSMASLAVFRQAYELPYANHDRCTKNTSFSLFLFVSISAHFPFISMTRSRHCHSTFTVPTSAHPENPKPKESCLLKPAPAMISVRRFPGNSGKSQRCKNSMYKRSSRR